MPTESEQIAALTRMLKQAQAKNDKLKEQLEKKNKQVADLTLILQTRRQAGFF